MTYTSQHVPVLVTPSMKPILCLVVSAMLLALTPPVVADWTFVRGDVSGDGDLQINDALAGLDYLFGGATVACLDAVDANDDGGLDVSDPIFTLHFLFADGAPPAPPFPLCGVDPTIDGIGCEGSQGACPPAPAPLPARR